MEHGNAIGTPPLPPQVGVLRRALRAFKRRAGASVCNPYERTLLLNNNEAPGSLVHADFGGDQDDAWEESWNDAITAELEKQFGKRAKPTFGFELEE